VFGKKFACKNIQYREPSPNFSLIPADNNLKIYTTLIEYCISKICSALKVGIGIERALGFDLICYSNCIQFFMEVGTNVGQNDKKRTELL
jgi:hypothetical protein